jgi:hypothetical protein
MLALRANGFGVNHNMTTGGNLKTIIGLLPESKTRPLSLYSEMPVCRKFKPSYITVHCAKSHLVQAQAMNYHILRNPRVSG